MKSKGHKKTDKGLYNYRQGGGKTGKGGVKRQTRGCEKRQGGKWVQEVQTGGVKRRKGL